MLKMEHSVFRFLKCIIWEVAMKKNNEIITNDIDKFPEFENIRNAILEAREKVATTVNFAMVSAYWTIGKQLHEAMSGDGSIYGKQLIKYVSVRLSEEFGQGFDERNLRNMRQYNSNAYIPMLKMEHSVFRIELVALQIAYAYKGTRKKRVLSK